MHTAQHSTVPLTSTGPRDSVAEFDALFKGASRFGKGEVMAPMCGDFDWETGRVQPVKV